MTEELKTTKMGKLRIYMTTGESIQSKNLLRRFFPKTKYLKIMEEAKAFGILNAHVFHTHAAVQKGGKITHYSIEGDTSGLTVCLELVDEKKKLQHFFINHKDILKENTAIYKDVEFWEYSQL